MIVNDEFSLSSNFTTECILAFNDNSNDFMIIVELIIVISLLRDKNQLA